MKGERAKLEELHRAEISLRRGYDTGSWVSLGVGITSMGAMGYFLYQAFDSYAKYQGATSPGQARAMREATQSSQYTAIGAGIVGGVALTTALMLQLLGPRAADTQREIDALDRAIEKLQEASR
jgi:hypothetical protein